MCGITGFFGTGTDIRNAINSLKLMKERGKDNYGILIDNRHICHDKSLPGLEKQTENQKAISGVLGHNLHSVVGETVQPFNEEGISFVANCEIYNWKQLKTKYGITASNDAELLFKLINHKDVSELDSVLEEVDGVYAFAYQTSSKIYLARDILGVKPLWYSPGFGFASEKKALPFPGATELNPRHILIFDKLNETLTFKQRDFFKITPEHAKDYDALKTETKHLLEKAIKKRLPDRKFGLLFSGGIDSVFIALLCKKLGYDFTCYTVAIDEPGLKESEDLVYAQKIAKDLGLKLQIRYLKLPEIHNYLKTIIPLIEDSNVVKAGVALVFYVACEHAKKDNLKVMFSGLGSEEIFAGYERHAKSGYINKECLSGLLNMYQRDLYRDDVVCMNNRLELRLPYLDKDLARFALRIPAEYKLNVTNKKILRDIALDMGLDKQYAMRGKKAAQYGSKTDKAIQKLAKQNSFKYKSEYLNTFSENPNLKLVSLSSGGKDSLYSMYLMYKRNFEITCIATITSKNKDSYMYHTPNVDLVKLQAESLNLPLIEKETEGIKEQELDALEKALQEAKERFAVQGIVTGALYSSYQRERVEKVADRLGLKVFSPLWHMDQEYEMRDIIKKGFTIVLSSVAAYGLDKSWLGRELNLKDIDKLVELKNKYGLNVAGEGGEFESLVIDMPLFKKKIYVKKSRIYESSPEKADFIILDAELQDK